jgi:hypothetical protein
MRPGRHLTVNSHIPTLPEPQLDYVQSIERSFRLMLTGVYLQAIAPDYASCEYQMKPDQYTVGPDFDFDALNNA